jgi:hypothetical protein
MFLLVGLLVGIAAAGVNYHCWQNKKVVAWLLGISVASLFLVERFLNSIAM